MPYSITTKDGITIDNIPDDVAADSPELKQRVARERSKISGNPEQQQDGISIEQTATTPQGGYTMPNGLPQQVPEVTNLQPATAAPEEPGFFSKLGEAITGSGRVTPESQTLPEWTTMPEMNQLSIASARSGIGTILSSPEETIQILKSNFPDIQVRQDVKGNYVMKSSINGQEYIIPPGVSMGDLPRILAGFAGFSPVGAATNIPRAAMGAAATQSVIEGSQASAGGTYNPEDIAITGLAGGAVPVIGKAISMTGKPAADAIQRIREGLQPVGTPIEVSATRLPPQGTMGSVGARGVDVGTLRQAKSEELPYPIPLTKGQKTRSFEDVQFERETAKIAEAGEPLRQRFTEQNQKIIQNLDAFIDMTGAERRELRDVGMAVDEALKSRINRDKTKIRTLYADADKSGELNAPVTLKSIVDHLVENEPEAEVANLLKTARAKAIRLGIARETDDGQLVAQPVTLKIAETFRKSINNATNAEPTNIRQASIMKGLIDAETEGKGGDVYRRARAARAKYAKDYEEIGIISDLVNTKRGTADRKIALENVLDRTIISQSSSLDDIRQLRRILHTEGEKGHQAWKELQGATLQYIRDQVTKSASLDTAGNTAVSPARLNQVIKNLDKSGKLDFIFGKKGAEQIRLLNDVAQFVLTVPTGIVNTSNTASVILSGMADMVISGMAGYATPVVTTLRFVKDKVKDRQLRKRIQNALEGK